MSNMSRVAPTRKRKKLSKNVAGTCSHEDIPRKQMNFNCLKKMYDDKLLCDFTFIVDGKELTVHKLILSICSTKFYEKFVQDREFKCFNTMKIENISYATLSAVIGYLYTSTIAITGDNLGELLTAASDFVLLDLQQRCHDFLKKKPDELLKLSYGQIEALISGDSTCATAEKFLEYVLKWVGGNPLLRRDRLHLLLKHVRFSSIPQKKAFKMLEENQWFKDYAMYDSILAEIFKRYTQDTPLTSLGKPKPRQVSTRKRLANPRKT